MTTPNGSSSGPADEQPPAPPSRALHEWASSIETSFLEIHQTLTNPDTAASYQRTLDVMERTLQGSHAHDIITADQLKELTGILQGLRQVPGIL